MFFIHKYAIAAETRERLLYKKMKVNAVLRPLPPPAPHCFFL